MILDATSQGEYWERWRLVLWPSSANLPMIHVFRLCQLLAGVSSAESSPSLYEHVPRSIYSKHCFVQQQHAFFFNDSATTEIYTLSLHDALPIQRLLEV